MKNLDHRRPKYKIYVSALALIALVLWTGCNHLFYYPSHTVALTPSKLQIAHKEFTIPSSDHVTLSGWWMMPPKDRRIGRVVLQLHGNAENMTTHFLYVAWLVSEGYDVVTWDYRGYGQSSLERPSQLGLIDDTCAVLGWISREKSFKNLPLFVVAQSLGGAVATGSIPKCPAPQLKGLVIDSTFSSYRRIARAKLGQFWPTWPLQYPLALLVSDDVDLIDNVKKIRVPVLFFHSTHDPVVPYDLGYELFSSAPQPKEFVALHEPGHTRALTEKSGRDKVLQFFNAALETSVQR
jgi:alpha-beta hydrolase superfamily lysophospholipase